LPSLLVVATKESSFFLAAPEAIDSRAFAIPSTIDGAIPAAYSAAPALRTTISRGVPSTLESA